MTLKLSSGIRDRHLGSKSVSNLVAYGEAVTVADPTSTGDGDWVVDDANTTLTGAVTYLTHTNCLSLASAAGAGEVSVPITVIPGHYYRFSYYGTLDGAVTGLYAKLGTSSFGGEIFDGTADASVLTLNATWTQVGYATNETGAANEEYGPMVFSALASTSTIYITLGVDGVAQTAYFNYVRLEDLGTSVREIFRTGQIKIYSGAQPSSPDDAASGTLLVTIDSNGGDGTGFTFLESSGGTMAKSNAETWTGTIASTGVAGYARLVQHGDTGLASTTAPRIDLGVSTSGSQVNMSTTSLVAGATVSVSSFSITIPAS